MDIQEFFAHVIKPACAGNFLHVQGIICKYIHACDGKPFNRKYTDNFFYSGAMIWNTIPSDVREAESFSAFKSSYVKWYRQ